MLGKGLLHMDSRRGEQRVHFGLALASRLRGLFEEARSKSSFAYVMRPGKLPAAPKAPGDVPIRVEVVRFGVICYRE